ncbi:MAG: T9SS type A sorting domain-containing protein, partial [Flavobacteriaceae bacterium]
QSLTVGQANLTIVGLTGDNKAFDGTTAATASGIASLSGIVGADDVTLGGTPVYTFASAAVGTGITITTTGYTISGTDAGNYTLTQPTLSADITGNALTLDDISISDETCDGANDGSATVTVSGGTAPYSYEWSTGVTTTSNVLSGLEGGDYSVTVVDALNNFVMQDFTIAEGATLDVTVTENQTVYYGYPPAANTTIGVEQIVGGSAPYTYVWSTGETTQNIHVCPTDTTTYTVTVTDANGCSTTANVVVNVVDVRCNHGHHGHYGRKHFVKVCHKGRKTICIPWWAAKWHLWHGDTLGGCDSEPNQVEITNLKVFPNPFKRHLHVKFNSTATANVDLLIYNHRGALVFQKALTVNEGQTKTKLNLSHLKRGRYYLKAVVNGEVKRIRHLIKH